MDFYTPSRELDELIATKVLGWYWGPVRDPQYAVSYPSLSKQTYELSHPDGRHWFLSNKFNWMDFVPVHRYSSSFADSWRDLLLPCRAWDLFKSESTQLYNCVLFQGRYASVHGCITPELAICLAALRLHDVDVPGHNID